MTPVTKAKTFPTIHLKKIRITKKQKNKSCECVNNNNENTNKTNMDNKDNYDNTNKPDRNDNKDTTKSDPEDVDSSSGNEATVFLPLK